MMSTNNSIVTSPSLLGSKSRQMQKQHERQKDTAEFFRNRLLRCVLLVMVLGYQETGTNAFAALTCDASCAKKAVHVDPSIECWKQSHIAMGVVSILSLALYIIPMIVAVLVKVSSAHSLCQLTHRDFRSKYGVLYEDFKLNRWYACVAPVIMSFVIAIGTGAITSSKTQLSFFTALFVVYLKWLIITRPYKEGWQTVFALLVSVGCIAAQVLNYLGVEVRDNTDLVKKLSSKGLSAPEKRLEDASTALLVYYGVLIAVGLLCVVISALGRAAQHRVHPRRTVQDSPRATAEERLGEAVLSKTGIAAPTVARIVEMEFAAHHNWSKKDPSQPHNGDDSIRGSETSSPRNQPAQSPHESPRQPPAVSSPQLSPVKHTGSRETNTSVNHSAMSADNTRPTASGSGVTGVTNASTTPSVQSSPQPARQSLPPLRSAGKPLPRTESADTVNSAANDEPRTSIKNNNVNSSEVPSSHATTTPADTAQRKGRPTLAPLQIKSPTTDPR